MAKKSKAMGAALVPETRNIEVTFDSKTREVTISPTGARLCAGQQVQWTFPPGTSYLLIFPSGQPFGQTEFRGRQGDRGACACVQQIAGNIQGSGNVQEAAYIQGARNVGVFHYQVILSNGGQIYADTSCPTVIIEK